VRIQTYTPNAEFKQNKPLFHKNLTAKKITQDSPPASHQFSLSVYHCREITILRKINMNSEKSRKIHKMKIMN